MSVAEDQELLAFTNCKLENKDDSTLIVNQRNGKELLVQKEVAITLTHLTHFKTLNQHASDLINLFPQLQGDFHGVQSVLKSVRDAGIMFRANEFITDLKENPIALRKNLPSSRVFIITCDRPIALERLLSSMAGAGSLEIHDSIFVIDNSRLEGNILKNQNIVEVFNNTNIENIIYFGTKRQDMLLRHLLNSSSDEKGIRFVADQKKWLHEASYGLSRNICLLMSIGYRALILDDDILCHAVKAPLIASGLVFGEMGNRQALFYESREYMQQISTSAGFNPLMAHLKVLGENITPAIESLQKTELTENALEGCNAAFINAISTRSQILISQCGSWGDPGTNNPHWIMNLDDNSVEKILKSSNGLSEALTKRACWVGHARPCLSKNANISQLTGLDNSQLLPPYFPVFRGEDNLFGTMANYMHPGSLVANLSWAIPHLPIEDRSDRGVLSPVVGNPGLGLLSQHISEIMESNKSESSRDYLKVFSEIFSKYSESDTYEILSLFKSQRKKRLLEATTQLESRQASNSINNRSWSGYLSRGIKELQVEMKNIEMINVDGNKEEILRCKEMAADFSASLANWESMRAHIKSFDKEITGR